MVIEELQEIADTNIKKLTYEDDDWSWDFDRESFTDPKSLRRIAISCRDHRCSAVFDLSDGEMTINIDCSSHTLKIGRGTQFPDLKKSFFKLYKQVKEYRTVEQKREEEEEFIKKMYKHFPHLMDKILLGSENEE
jgi:hypothetical protein